MGSTELAPGSRARREKDPAEGAAAVATSGCEASGCLRRCGWPEPLGIVLRLETDLPPGVLDVPEAPPVRGDAVVHAVEQFPRRAQRTIDDVHEVALGEQRRVIAWLIRAVASVDRPDA